MFLLFDKVYNIHSIELFSVLQAALIVFLSNLIFYYFCGLEMEYPGGKKQHFRHLLFFAFHRSQKAAEAAREICNVYGERVISESTARKWFAKFKNGDFDVDDTPEELLNSMKSVSKHF